MLRLEPRIKLHSVNELPSVKVRLAEASKFADFRARLGGFRPHRARVESCRACVCSSERVLLVASAWASDLVCVSVVLACSWSAFSALKGGAGAFGGVARGLDLAGGRGVEGTQGGKAQLRNLRRGARKVAGADRQAGLDGGGGSDRTGRTRGRFRRLWAKPRIETRNLLSLPKKKSFSLQN